MEKRNKRINLHVTQQAYLTFGLLHAKESAVADTKLSRAEVLENIINYYNNNKKYGSK